MIQIKNIYYMLCYAYKALNKEGFKTLETESFDHIADLCGEILIKGLEKQLKQGLGRTYISRQDALSTPKGKLNISASLRTQNFMRKRVVCSYDEFSIDAYKNRIIKTTIEILLKSDMKKDRKKRLRRLSVYFDKVQNLEIHSINWNIQYHKNNQTYRMLISICYLVIHGLIQNKTDGVQKFMDFDEKSKASLYENFVREYYKKEFPALKVHAPWIKWQLDDNQTEFLPVMRTDITLEYQNRMLIIDTKYYSTIMNSWRDKKSICSNNLYQIYTYVKNKEAELRETPHELAGMLLYAQTDEQITPDNIYRMDGNTIAVKTLDLNQDFSEIRKTLNTFVYSFFPSL